MYVLFLGAKTPLNPKKPTAVDGKIKRDNGRNTDSEPKEDSSSSDQVKKINFKKRKFK